MSKITMRGGGSVSSAVSIIQDGVEQSGISCELVDRADRYHGDVRSTLLVFEKYYWRAGNRASLSVLVSGTDGNVTVDAIGSGGGNGIFLSFSWGAEESFVYAVKRALEAHGFTER